MLLCVQELLFDNLQPVVNIAIYLRYCIKSTQASFGASEEMCSKAAFNSVKGFEEATLKKFML